MLVHTGYLLGVVRIYSKKAEYLFDDCNKVLLNIKDFVLSNKDGILVETLQAPYFSITLPERFELHALIWRLLKILDHCEEFVACGDTWSADYSMNEEYGT
uniref:Rad21/Rec8-like protein N-terminal domain-containing protein n=1 Tax=Salix viminalis TaxID=40686 RepID=A0A6N2MNI7_SALVM